MSYTSRRFKSPLTQVKSVNAGVRYINKEKGIIEVFLPEEIFKSQTL